jgi:hypothetical protein
VTVRIVFQLLLLIVVVISVLAMFRSVGSQRNQALRRVSYTLFILLAGVSIIFPDLISQVAHWVGIGRGTDLVLYLFIVVSIWFTASAHRRFRAMEATQTHLIRNLALSEAPPADEAARAMLGETPSETGQLPHTP